MKKTMLAVALILVLASATFVMAGPYAKRAGCPLGFGPFPPQVDLNLTSEQAEKILALRQSNFDARQEVRNRLHQKRAEMRLAWMQLEPDVEKVRKIQSEINELRAMEQERSIEHRMALREILTPEQLTGYLAMSGWGGKRHPGMMGRSYHPRAMTRGMSPPAFYGPGAGAWY